MHICIYAYIRAGYKSRPISGSLSALSLYRSRRRRTLLPSRFTDYHDHGTYPTESCAQERPLPYMARSTTTVPSTARTAVDTS